MYGSTVWNMFPWSVHLNANVSWEGHLAGGISGFLLAIIFKKHGPQKPVKVWDDEDDEDDEDDIDDFLDAIIDAGGAEPIDEEIKD